MAAPKGNQFYKLVKNWKHGADRKYQPDELWEAFVKYCEWVEANPIPEEKVFGTGFCTSVGKMRAMTIKGFCIHANMSSQTFLDYDKQEAYFGITKRIKDIIFTQKFEGAASDMFNANIIARELSLVDLKEVSGRDGGPIQTASQHTVVFTDYSDDEHTDPSE